MTDAQWFIAFCAGGLAVYWCALPLVRADP